MLHGSHISQRQLVRRGGWYDGADALYCRRTGDLFDIAAIAEVKSKATPMEEILEQVARNLLRLRRGFRYRGEGIAAERVRITASGRTVAAADIDEEHARAVTTLVIVPATGADDGTPVPLADRASVWRAELPYVQDDITEAAYRFVAWYFAEVGNDPHAFMEAIYHTALRKTFDPNEKPQPGRRTAWQTLLWLYNSMGFGYEQASADELMFPDFEPNPHHQAWLERHNAAMAEYYAGRIAAALERFPDPAQQTYADWAPREWILLARLRARNGDAKGAREALGRLGGDPHQSVSLSTRMEAAAVDVLIAITAGEDAQQKLRFAEEVIGGVRQLVADHESRGWGFPDKITPSNARAAIIDLAVAYVLLGDERAAVETLMPLRGIDEGQLELIANDPVLSRVSRKDGMLDALLRASAQRHMI